MQAKTLRQALLFGTAVSAINIGMAHPAFATCYAVDGSGNVDVSACTAGTAISSATGSLTNSGTINAVGTNGIAVSGSIGGGLTNSGTITSTNKSGITIGGNVGSGVLNEAGGSIGGQETTLFINGTVTGTFTNAGTITSTTRDAAHIIGNLDGSLVNSGTLTALGFNGMSVNGTVTSDVTNTGVISALDNGLVFHGNIGGSIYDGGTITVVSNAGIYALANVGGSVTVASGTTISNTGGFGIYVMGNTSGTITPTHATGIFVAGTIGGGITNNGAIAVGQTGIFINGTLSGDLVNAGRISASGNYGVQVTGNVGGSIEDGGSISAPEAGIYVAGNVGGSVTVDAGTTITNSGGYGIQIGNNEGFVTPPTQATGIFVMGTIGGGITNNGTISTPYSINDYGSVPGDLVNTGKLTASRTAIFVGGTIGGGVTNSGVITANGNGAVAIEGSITGNVVNTASGSIDASTGGFGLNLAAVGGTVANAGAILAARTGILGSSIGGDLVNSGTITPGAGKPGIKITGTVSGNVSNTGTITQGTIGIMVGAIGHDLYDGGGISASHADIYVTGNVGGTITVASGTTISNTGGFGINVENNPSASAPVNGTGIVVRGTIGGGIVNNGVIESGLTGIHVAGPPGSNGLVNTGTIIGGNGVAIDYTADTAASTITQAGGVIQGAVNLSPSFADLMSITGGTVTGSITGSAATVDFATGSTYTLTNGINVGAINVQSGTLVLNHDVGVTGTLTNSATLEVDATRTITGSFAQTASGTLNIGLDKDTNSVGELVVSQNAAIDPNSTITLKELGSTFNTGLQTLTIVAAGGTGSYTGVNVTPATITIANPYIPLAVGTSIVGNDLVVTLTPPSSGPSNSGVPFDNSGPTSAGQQQVDAALNATTNSRSVAGALTQLYQSGSNAASTILSAINNYFNDTSSSLTEAQKIQVVSAQLAPSNASVDAGTSQAFSSASTTAVVQHLQTARALDHGGETGLAAGSPTQNSAFWGQLLGYTARRSSDSDTLGDKTKSMGAAFGADTLVAPHLRLGGSFSYGKSYVNGLDLASSNSTHVDSYQLSAYGTYDAGAWYVNGQVGLGFDNYNQSRGIDFMAGSARANYDGLSVLTHIDAGRDFQFGATKLTPIASLTYIHQAIDSYTESTTNEHIGSVNLNSVQTELGGQASWLIPVAGGQVMPTIKIGWLHDWIHSAIQTTATLGGVSFNTFAARPAADGADIGLAATFYSKGNWQLQAQYNLNLYRDYTSNAALVNLKLHF